VTRNSALNFFAALTLCPPEACSTQPLSHQSSGTIIDGLNPFSQLWRSYKYPVLRCKTQARLSCIFQAYPDPSLDVGGGTCLESRLRDSISICSALIT
ncbi:hypothetical protein BD779DRAFT_1800887, partial [Infundibulicybe gibba]